MAIQPGGKSTQVQGTETPAQDDAGVDTGEFKTASERRDVTAHPGEPVIDSTLSSFVQDKSLNDWEIGRQDFEQTYLLSEGSVMKEKRPTFDQGIDNLCVKLESLSKSYEMRIAALLKTDMIDQNQSESLSGAVAHLQSFIKQFKNLKTKKALGLFSIKSEKDRTRIDNARALLNQVSPLIKETQTRLKLHTAPNVQPEPAESVSSLTIEPEKALNQRLSKLTTVTTPREAQEWMATTQEDIQSIMAVLPRWIQQTQATEEEQDQLSERQYIFSNAFEKLQALGNAPLNKKNMSSTLSQARDLLTQCHQQITWMQYGIEKALHPSFAKTISNRRLAELAVQIDIAKASGKGDFQAEQGALKMFLNSEMDRLFELRPLIELARKKCDVEGKAVSGMYDSTIDNLKRLGQTIHTANGQEALSLPWQESLMSIDKTLTHLAQFDFAQLMSDLTFLPDTFQRMPHDDSPRMSYALNLLCRTIIVDAAGAFSLSDRRTAMSFMQQYLDGKADNHPDKIKGAVSGLSNLVFSSPDALKTTLDRAKNVQEVLQLMGTLRFNTAIERPRQRLISMRDNIESAKREFDRQERGFFRNSASAIDKLITELPESIETRANRIASKRFDRVSAALTSAINEQISERMENPTLQERFSSEEAFYETIQKEFNDALLGVGYVLFEPGSGGDVLPTVQVLLTKESLDGAAFSDFLNNPDPLCQGITEALKKTDGELFVQNPVDRRWQCPAVTAEKLNQYKNEIITPYQQFSDALSKVATYEQTLQRYENARREINDQASHFQDALQRTRPVHQGFFTRNRTTDAVKQLTGDMMVLQDLPLKAIPESANQSVDTITGLVLDRQLAVGQAVSLLNPLHEIIHSAEHRNDEAPCRNQCQKYSHLSGTAHSSG